jgi:hypothetical protein
MFTCRVHALHMKLCVRHSPYMKKYQPRLRPDPAADLIADTAVNTLSASPATSTPHNMSDFDVCERRSRGEGDAARGQGKRAVKRGGVRLDAGAPPVLLTMGGRRDTMRQTGRRNTRKGRGL